VVDALWNGVAGTSMQAWRDHSPGDLAALADVVRALDATSPPQPAPVDSLALGARVYAANCVQCHGQNGDGRGSAAAELRIAPTSLRAQRPSLAVVEDALAKGVDGTQMAPWIDRLSRYERTAVVRYVRGLFQGNPSAEGGR
jgi:mono/diheme cytochrome c family protein